MQKSQVFANNKVSQYFHEVDITHIGQMMKQKQKMNCQMLSSEYMED